MSSSSIETWEIPSFDADAPSIDDVESIFDSARQDGFQNGFKEGHAAGFNEGRREGYEQGYNEGHKQGLDAGREEVSVRVNSLDQILKIAAKPIDAIDSDVRSELVGLVATLVSRIARYQADIDPLMIRSVCDDALESLPSSARNVLIKVNPEDYEFLKGYLEDRDDYRVVEDPSISRGGCIVDSSVSRVNATLESRIEDALKSLYSSSGVRSDA